LPCNASAQSPWARQTEPEADIGMNEARARIDKWLWAARFYKTRALATEEIGRGRVTVNGQLAKASRELKPGDEVNLRQGAVQRTVAVRVLSTVRGPSPVAQTLYAETAESIAERQRAAEQRRLCPEPASTIEQGRPTKRDRRQLAEWQRWSASADDPGRRKA
jgi:ribosome-associated heat shock protein Hsp15